MRSIILAFLAISLGAAEQLDADAAWKKAMDESAKAMRRQQANPDKDQATIPPSKLGASIDATVAEQRKTDAAAEAIRQSKVGDAAAQQEASRKTYLDQIEQESGVSPRLPEAWRESLAPADQVPEIFRGTYFDYDMPSHSPERASLRLTAGTIQNLYHVWSDGRPEREVERDMVFKQKVEEVRSIGQVWVGKISGREALLIPPIDNSAAEQVTTLLLRGRGRLVLGLTLVSTRGSRAKPAEEYLLSLVP